MWIDAETSEAYALDTDDLILTASEDGLLDGLVLAYAETLRPGDLAALILKGSDARGTLVSWFLDVFVDGEDENAPPDDPKEGDIWAVGERLFVWTLDKWKKKKNAEDKEAEE